jgi:drug/metabolite transporter (DMT)-like permease
MSTTLSLARPNLPSRLGLVEISAASMLWGTVGVVAQIVGHATGLSPIGICFYRLAIAATVLVVLNSRRVRTLRPSRILILTGLGLATYQALYFIAAATCGVTVATVISLGLAPVLTVGWETARTRRRPHPVTVASVAAGVAGLAILAAAQPSAAAPHPLLGLLAATGSGLGYAATTLASKHAAERTEPMALTTVSTAIGALALTPLAVISGVTFTVRPASVLMLGYLGVVTTAVAFVLLNRGLRTTAGSTAAVLTLLDPLTAAVLAVLVLGEPLSIPTMTGAALLLTAIGALYRVKGEAGT